VNLLELSDLIEFSPKGNVIIYWMDLQPIGEKNEAFGRVMAKYIINFLAVGRLFYNDDVTCNLEIYKGTLYEKNLNKYPEQYRKILLDAANSEKEITIEELLKETSNLQKSYIQCSNCGTLSILHESEKHICRGCENTLEIIATLVSSDQTVKIPIAVGTIVSVWDSIHNKYENVIKVLKDPKHGIGFKNISNETWTVMKIDGEKSVGRNDVAKVLDSKTFKIKKCEYSYVPTTETEVNKYGEVD
jgi:hypothetical protein